MTNYLIAHVPYGSSMLLEDHGLTGDSARLAEQVREPYLDQLFTADEKVMFGISRLCCDVGAYLRDRSTEDLVPKYIEERSIRANPSSQQIAAATMLAQQHELRLSTQIEAANSLIDVFVLDARSFDGSCPGGMLPLPDICLGFNEVEPTAVVLSAAESFKAAGLRITINDPIRGCLLPPGYAGHSSTFGMTVALNRRLYLDGEGQLAAKGFDAIKAVLADMYIMLTEYNVLSPSHMIGA